MARGGRRTRAGEPERRCIVARAARPRHGLVRFVVGPDGAVVPDLAGRLPGRGLWVSAERAALARAVEKNLFARAARRPVTVAPDLVEQVEQGLARRVIDLLALARRAGQAVAGREKVRAALLSGRAALLVQACDGSPREKAAFRPPAGEASHIGVLSAAELGMAFGRERVIHAAVDGGGLADRVRGEALRLSGFRTDGAGQGARRTMAGEGSRGERLVEDG